MLQIVLVSGDNKKSSRRSDGDYIRRAGRRYDSGCLVYGDRVSSTQRIDFHEIQDFFLSFIPKDGHILDFGCGAGRDTKCFLDRGFSVEAIDGSEEMCKAASEYTGIAVKHMMFEDLDDTEKYDGIWACASILHVPSLQLPDVIVKMAAALKPDGIIYISFKYGDFEGERNGRYFTDQTEGSLKSIIDLVNRKMRDHRLETKRVWITEDVREDRNKKWLNVLLERFNCSTSCGANKK